MVFGGVKHDKLFSVSSTYLLNEFKIRVIVPSQILKSSAQFNDKCFCFFPSFFLMDANFVSPFYLPFAL